jgi:hypothetical protein
MPTGREGAGMHGLGTPEDLQRFLVTGAYSAGRRN